MRNETIRLPFFFFFPKLSTVKSEPKCLKLVNDTESPVEIDP